MTARLLAVLLASAALGCGEEQRPPDVNPCPADTPLESPTPPPLRSHFAGTFDVLTQSMYVFSGDPGQPLACAPSGMAPLTDLWRYSVRCQYWIQVTPPTMPPPRTGAATAHEGFPANRNRMIMFGGRGADGQLLNDVWAFDFLTQTWSQLMAKPPDGGTGDPDGGTGDPDGGTSDTPPSPREYATLVYNASLDQMFLFGGNTNADASQPTLQNDVWMLDMDQDVNTWTQMPVMGVATTQPVPRWQHVSAFDPVVQTLYVGFGQNTSGSYLKDLWAYTYDLSKMPPVGGWRLAWSGANGPTARILSGMDIDNGGSRLLMFGGIDQEQGPRNDLWEFSLGPSRSWKLDQTGDVAKNAGGSMCMRPADFVTPDLTMPERRSGMLFAFGYPGFPYVLGGQGDCGDLRDVWALLEGNGWLQLEDSKDGFSCARKMQSGCTSYCQ